MTDVVGSLSLSLSLTETAVARVFVLLSSGDSDRTRDLLYLYKSEVGPVVINQTVVIADDFGRCREGAAAVLLQSRVDFTRAESLPATRLNFDYRRRRRQFIYYRYLVYVLYRRTLHSIRKSFLQR